MQRKFTLLFVIFIGILSVMHCKTESSGEKDIDATMEERILKPFSFQVGNKLFSIPSPLQVTYFVNKNNIAFDKNLINPIEASDSYISNFKVALNLGVYGADICYLLTYGKYANSIEYLQIIESMQSQLGLHDVFSDNVFNRLEANIKDKDSLAYIISDQYKNADLQLIERDRNDLASLIILGGWIEGMHYLTNSDVSKEFIKQRISEQKYPVENLISLLRPFYNHSEEFDEILDILIEMAYIFDGVEYDFQYVPPVVDTIERITVIRSKTKVNISDYQLKSIISMTEAIRNRVVSY